MKKLSYIVTIFVAMVFLSVSTTFASSKVVTLQPGWNTFSTSKVLSALSFSNGSGAGLFFYQLGNGTWSSVQANTTNIRPLEWFVVNNTNTWSIQVGLEYATNLAPSDMLFQKTLSAGWNFVGVTTEATPFASIGSNATMSVDFTRTSGGSNLTNAVNSSFSTTTGNANIVNPELGEAYAVFMQSSGVYGGNQDQEYVVYATGNINVIRGLDLSDLFVGWTNIIAWAQTTPLYDITLSSTGSAPVSIPNISFSISATGAYQTNVSATLYISGIAVATKTITGSTLDFSGLDIVISNTQSSSIAIKADFSDIFSTGSIQVTLNNLWDATATSKPAGTIYTIVQPIGTLAATTGDTLVNKTLLLAGSANQKITSFKVTASNDSIKLKDLYLTGTNLNTLSNIRLTDSTGNVIVTMSYITDNSAAFLNLNSSVYSSIEMDKSAIFYIVADINSSTNQNGVQINIAVTSSDIMGSNGPTITMTGSNVSGASHDVSENTFKVTLGTPTSKSLATDAMEFTVNAFGKNSVTLSGATFSNVLSGYTGSTTLTVVRKSDNATVGSVSGTTGAISFTANNSIDAGSSATYIVKMVGALVDSGSNSQDWTVSLTGLTTTDSLNAANYPKNTDTFPLTSNK